MLNCGANCACKDGDFNLDCVDDGCNVAFSGVQAAPGVSLTANSVSDILCVGISACENGTINAECVSDGCGVSCGGSSNACKNTTQNISNVHLLKCEGTLGCGESDINIQCVGDGCGIECGRQSCVDTEITASNVDKVGCSGFQSCKGSTFDISYIAAGDGSIECGESACEDTTLTLVGSQMIKCTGLMGCVNANIAATPNNNDWNLLCSGNSCINTNVDVTVPVGVTVLSKIECSGDNACQNITINVNTAGQNVVISDILCGSPSACSGAVITIPSGVTITNNGGFDVVVVNVRSSVSKTNANNVGNYKKPINQTIIKDHDNSIYINIIIGAAIVIGIAGLIFGILKLKSKLYQKNVNKLQNYMLSENMTKYGSSIVVE